MSRKVDYFVASQVAPTEEACTLIGLDARYVPALIRGISPYLERAFWLSDEDYARGYQGAAKAMEALLMDCGTTIVNNIIALRGLDPAAPRDETTGVPLTSAPGSTLLDLYTTLQTPTGTPGAALGAIQAATEATASNVATGLGVGGDAGDLAFLAQLLAVV